jgi:Domain of unknown function (DUF5615)
VTAFMIDEMFPAPAAALLRDEYGHDAVHVTEAGLRGAPDTRVAAAARADGRAVVTENVADFAAERDVVLIFVLEQNLPAGGGQAPPSQPSSTAGTTSNPDSLPRPAVAPHRLKTTFLPRCGW